MLRSLVALSLVLLPTVASAQDACRRGYLVPEQLVPNTSSSRFSTGDFDKDGRPDLIALTIGNVDVLLNRGAYIFERVQSMPAPYMGGDVHVADVTGDGNLDYILRDGYTVAIAPGRGNGTFAPFVETGDMPVPAERMFFDADGDGRPEFVELAGGSLFVYKIRDDATVALVSSAPTPNFWWTRVPWVAADLDGDGRTDMASFTTFTTWYPRIQLFWNEGNGVFRHDYVAWSDLPMIAAYGGAVNIDGDAAAELVALYQGKLYVFEANGRKFSWSATAVNGPPVDGPLAIGADDLDRDGALDLIFRGATTTVAWGPREGESGHTLAHFDFAAAALADMNGDGIADVVNDSGPRIDVLHAVAGSRELPAAPVVPFIGGTHRDLFEADIDRDGRMDIISGSNWERITVLLRGEGATFVVKLAIKEHSVRGVADVDGDGHLDLITRNEWEHDATHVHFGASDFTFSAPMAVTSGAWFEGVAARSGGNILIFKTLAGEIQSISVANRQVSAATHIGTVDARGEVSVADVDGDGDGDVVGGERNAYSFFIQDGNAWTRRPVELPLDMRADEVLAADLDRDGRTDLILLEEGAWRALLARGDGTYSTQVPAGSSPGIKSSMRLTDFDRDGLLDLVVNGRQSYGHLVYLYRNTGAGFEPHGVFPVLGSHGGALVVEDVDRDGWEDVLFSHSSGLATLRNVCTESELRVAVTPARALEGDRVTIRVTVNEKTEYSPGRVIVRKNGAILQVYDDWRAYDFGGVTLTLEPLPVGTHELEVEGQFAFGRVERRTVTVTVEPRGPRRRAVGRGR